MIKIANAQLWVHDQDEALAFYTQKLGMEVRADVTLAESSSPARPRPTTRPRDSSPRDSAA